MILVIEPNCREFSHEKVNSGFLYGLRLAFPNDKIRFYADSTHIDNLKYILSYDKIEIDNIEFVSITLSDSTTLGGAIHYYKLFKRIFVEVINFGTNKVFFLSYTPVEIYLIKRLKKRVTFAELKFTIVLHGDFESITGDTRKENPLVPVHRNDINRITAFERLRYIKPKAILQKIYRLGVLFFKTCGTFFTFRISISQWFPTKKMLLWKNSPDFRYIALSEHVITNAAKYIDIEKIDIRTVILPTNFASIKPEPKNKYIKFGIFGYGSSKVLQEIGYRLSKKKITKRYEIRIIGMDNSGISEYPNITCPSEGKPLKRQDMEKYAQDIDIFMILYHKGQYRLTCSGTILEAISNSTPILHFDNDCINSFNKSDNPIGICCNSVDGYVERMVDIISNYESYIPQFQLYRNNIVDLREKFSVKSSVPRIRESFIWES
jgi:hypothetical protein